MSNNRSDFHKNPGIAALDFIEATGKPESESKKKYVVDYINEHKKIPDAINAVDEEGDTALITAVRNDNQFAIKLLVEIECLDVNHQNKLGNSALMVAAQFNNTNAIDLLAKISTVNINLQNKSGNTALMIGAQSGTIFTFRALLQFEGINFDIVNAYKTTVKDIVAKDRDKNRLINAAQCKPTEAKPTPTQKQATLVRLDKLDESEQIRILKAQLEEKTQQLARVTEQRDALLQLHNIHHESISKLSETFKHQPQTLSSSSDESKKTSRPKSPVKLFDKTQVPAPDQSSQNQTRVSPGGPPGPA